jgi:hypothetical protein
VLFLLFSSTTAAASGDPLEERRAICTSWMMSAYPSGLEETACNAEFNLPSPFLFLCTRALQVGYKNETQKEACRLMFLRAARDAERGYVLN